jgi:hypothetical protein
MDVDRFWPIIDRAPDEDALRAALEPLSREELAEFAGLVYAFRDRAWRQDVWGAGYTLDGGMSDDSFTDFRSWLISQGRAAYEAVLINPDSLADAVPGLVVGEYHTDETYVHEAFELYEDRYGEDPPGGDYDEAVAASLPPAERARREHPISDEGWAGDVQRRYPRLLALITEQDPPVAGTLVDLWGNTDDIGPARFAYALRDADWPDGVEPGGQAWMSDDPRVGGVRLRVGAGFGGHEIGDLRAEYDERRVWVGWPEGRHWTDGMRPLVVAGVAAVAELEPEPAVAFAFDALIAQLRREVAHLVWLDDAGVTIHHCCLHIDDGTGGWSSDFEHRPLPPRRPPDRIIRYRPVA